MARIELTPRQTQVLRLVADGQTNDEIAAKLGICASTVKQHVMVLRLKLGEKSKRKLAARAREVIAQAEAKEVAA